MNFKDGVIFDGVRQEIWYALGVCQCAFLMLVNKPFIVTSLKDGHHGPTSLHPSGKAADIRTRHLNEVQIEHVYLFLKRQLSALGFDVVLESEHIHIEYDPQSNEKFISWVA